MVLTTAKKNIDTDSFSKAALLYASTREFVIIERLTDRRDSYTGSKHYTASGALVSINKVNLRRARLVLGWVIVTDVTKLVKIRIHQFQLSKFVECECRLIIVYFITRNAIHWFMSSK